MMKNLFSKTALSLLATASLFTSCIGDGDDTLVLEEGSRIEAGRDETKVVSSSESATFVRNGFTVTVPFGSVPKTNSNSDGKVAFSITQAEELPASLPSGVSVIRESSIKVEPMNFTFNSPITIKVPTQGEDIDKVALLRYNEYTNAWEEVPFSSINSDGTVSVSIIELGYFVLVKKNTSGQLGGVHISKRYLDEDYYYYLTLTPVNGNTQGIKRISFAPNGNDLYMANVPLGNYYATVSRERRSSLGQVSSSVQYCATNYTCNVTRALVKGSGSYETYTGWTELTISEDNWSDGRTNAWGTVTSTYGTGKFQATLTWVNATSDSYTDYDLHLYGPDNLHVYFSNKRQGVFELDRDWIREVGNATENLYNTDENIPSGTYTVKVHHYSGQTGKRYNCRIIMDGVVVKSVTSSIPTNGVYQDIYSFTIE